MVDYKALRDFIFLLCLVFLYWLLSQVFVVNGRNERVIKNHVVVCADIVDAKFIKLLPYFRLKYSYKGKTYYDLRPARHYSFMRYKTGIRNLLLVIEKEDPENYRVLDDLTDFAFFRITEEDTIHISCNWLPTTTN